MIEIVETDTFGKWIARLSDRRARTFITARLVRLANGMMGDTMAVGRGVSELRVHYGPGYRIYFHRDGETIVVLLCGGDQNSQQRDIAAAHKLARQWRQDHG